jgi:hypothetical protein
MRERLRKLWPVAKAVLAVVIVATVGRRFYLDLRAHPELWQQSLRPGWLALSGLLYVTGVGFSAFYWYRLLQATGQKPSLPAALRAYYVGQMGKYVPGKAYALVLRADLVRSPGVRGGLAGLTAFYEVLVTMAAGVLLAAVLAALLLPPSVGVDLDALRRLVLLRSPDQPVLHRGLVLALALILLAPFAVAILPPVFNRVAHRVSLPFRKKADPLPQLGGRGLAEGLGLTALGWLCLGTSVWAALEGTLAEPPVGSVAAWGRLTAFLGLAYVAGFVILVAPGGLGVREFLLTLFLVADPELLPGLPSGAREAAAGLVVVVLRLVWTLAEVVVAAAVWPLPRPAAAPEEERAP